jgi:hypothetical protein
MSKITFSKALKPVACTKLCVKPETKSFAVGQMQCNRTNCGQPQFKAWIPYKLLGDFEQWVSGFLLFGFLRWLLDAVIYGYF